jgi:hypothetical protein
MNNYEKKYKDALSWMQSLYDGLHGATKKDAEHYFPELKESEDERIRKELLEHCINRRDGKQVCVDASDYRRWANWLEKQGEQKQDPCDNCKDVMLNCHNFPCVKKRAFTQGKSALEIINEENVDNANKVEPKFKVGDTIKCKYDDRQFTIKSIDLDEGTYTYTQEGRGNYIDYADKEFELVEQKPVDKVEPKDYSSIDQHFGKKELKKVDQKLAWSEEDKDIMYNIISNLTELKDRYGEEYGKVGKCIGWIKFLKDRVGCEVNCVATKEWSVEDRSKIQRICKYLDEAKKYYADITEVRECIDWLKSLRPQSTWKPSDEQIKAVRLARSFVVDDFDENPTLSDVLVELEKQLKKLTE